VVKVPFWRLAALVMLVAPILCDGQGIITTVAGRASASGNAGCSSGPGDGCKATDANLLSPTGIALDAEGNLYIADNNDQRIRKVNTAGIISTVAGTGTLGFSGDGGAATSANLFSSWGVGLDGKGNFYIADRVNNRIRKVDAAGIITTVAGNGTAGFGGDGGPATSASLRAPQAVLFDGAGNMYIADTNNFRVRKVNPVGIITTIAGYGGSSPLGDGGAATSAGVGPASLALDAAGNMYIADTSNARIRKINTAGVMSTIAGTGTSGSGGIGDGGPAINAVVFPQGIALDAAGNIYVGDFGNNRVRKIDTAGIITTVAGGGTTGGGIGDGGPATSASLGGPAGVLIDPAGNLYIADSGHGHVRKVTFPAGAPSISANGVVNGASFVPGIVPNSWATIVGSSLAPVTDNWNSSIVNGRLPTSLDGVTVTIGGKSAYLYYVSPGQINLLVPDVALGPVQVIVKTPAGTSPTFTVTASQYGPAFFAWPNSQVVATRQDFSLSAKAGTFAGVTTVAAKPGDVLILWGTAFGPTAPVAPVGVQVPGDQTYSTATLPLVTINNVSAKVFGAALAPGFAGLYQVAIEAPASLADGDWPVVASIGGVSSPVGLVLSVKK
jgi:uncharacterized protein (TIGR03437 family)